MSSVPAAAAYNQHFQRRQIERLARKHRTTMKGVVQAEEEKEEELSIAALTYVGPSGGWKEKSEE